VGVLPQYRGRGLARTLMERVLDIYRGYPLIFLFAEGQVDGFYTRFGFRRIPEIQPCLSLEEGRDLKEPRTVPLEAEPVKRLAGAKLRRSDILDARENKTIYRFHLMYEFSEDIYHIPEYDIVFLARYDRERAHVFDILSDRPVSFDRIGAYIRRPQTREVCFHFTPDWLGIEYEPLPWKEDGLYVVGDALDGADPFRFPVTAHT